MNQSAIRIENPSAINIPPYKEKNQVHKKSDSTSRYIHNYNGKTDKYAPILKNKTSDEFDSIHVLSTVRELKNGEILIHEGDDVIDFYKIIFGHIKTYTYLNDGRCLVTQFLRKGDFIGLPHGKKHPISAQALTRTNVRCYSYRQMTSMMEKSPSIARKILNLAQKEISHATNQMILLGRKSTEEKIATFLLNCEYSSSSRDGFQSVVYFPMSLTDIADHLGLTQETVCRTFKKLKDIGLLKTKMPRLSREIYVRDMHTLSQIAESRT